jgi:MFS family permease
LWSFENRLLAALSLTEASMFIDRLALGFLASYVATDLALTNFQLGLLSSSFSLSFALSGYGISSISDRAGNRRTFLVGCTLAFSLLSAATGLTRGFVFLLVVRLLLGVSEGPVLPLLQSVMIPASSASRRAFNAAFLQNVAPFLLGQLLGPILLTHLAEAVTWRVTFLLSAVPGLVLVPILHRLIGRSSPAPAFSTGARIPDYASQVKLFRIRNLMLCVGIAACTGTWILLLNMFLPLYLVRMGGYPATKMGLIVSLLGVGGCLSSLTLPPLSDRIGRKPVLITGLSLGLVAPLGALMALHNPDVLMIAVALGGLALGCTPLTITLVPADSVPPHALARAIALTSASSAVIGGVIMPALAGRLADRWGLQIPIIIALGAACIAVLVAFGLEGRPVRELTSDAS